MIEAYREAGVAMLPVVPVIERARGSRSSAASFAGELVLAPLSARGTPWMRRLGRRVGRVRVRPDARARRPPPARVRPRLRAVGSRRLAGAAARRSRRPARRASSRRTATASRSRATSRRTGSTPASSAPRGKESRRRVKRFASLYDAIDRTTSTNAKVAAMVRYFLAAPPADAAWAVYLPDRPASQTPGSVRGDPGLDARGHRPRRLAARRVLRGGRRRRRDRRARARSGRGRKPRATVPLAEWVDDAHPAAARPGAGGAAGASQPLVARARSTRSASCC